MVMRWFGVFSSKRCLAVGAAAGTCIVLLNRGRCGAAWAERAGCGPLGLAGARGGVGGGAAADRTSKDGGGGADDAVVATGGGGEGSGGAGGPAPASVARRGQGEAGRVAPGVLGCVVGVWLTSVCQWWRCGGRFRVLVVGRHGHRRRGGDGDEASAVLRRAGSWPAGCAWRETEEERAGGDAARWARHRGRAGSRRRDARGRRRRRGRRGGGDGQRRLGERRRRRPGAAWRVWRGAGQERPRI